jgi:hypothetical protein
MSGDADELMLKTEVMVEVMVEESVSSSRDWKAQQSAATPYLLPHDTNYTS